MAQLTWEQRLDAFEKFLNHGRRGKKPTHGYQKQALYRLAGLFRQTAAWGATVEAKELVDGVRLRFAARQAASNQSRAASREKTKAKLEKKLRREIENPKFEF